ncbi:glycosyltransferase involved in cell wall biosynthesis [Rhodococcus sp. SMB37]|uniref:glycosyltransferase n=1 Tax=Rhodococcus sp. SMB37 TaxID=2512213 RepID=UPI001043C004|nr:glycosyltransferase [Rhodococcus sp. SMB37]TCN49166.1 glycosyltransferase involved in cell wall biosynthesis [Rhodococcus sp. SMB37]
MTKSVAILGTRGYPSYYGGFETLIRELSPYLVNEGWNVSVYGREGATNPNDPGLDPRVHRITTRGIESKSLSTLSYGLTSSFHTASQHPDVALIMNVANGFWLPILKARGIPTIVNVDGIEWERAKWGRKAKAAFKAGANLTARFADELIFDSRAIGDRWRSDFRRSGKFIPYGAVEPGQLQPVDNLKRGKYALMVARFVPENTVQEFFVAAQEISARWDVAIVGSSGYGGEFDQQAKALSESSDRIHWYGHLNDDQKLFSLWQNAGAYFHGHSVGGTNPALIQAMACGSPVVARDTVFNREVLGAEGLFVSPNPDDIARTVCKVLSNPGLQRHLSTNGKQRQSTDYTWAGVCQSYNSALLELVQSGEYSTK